MTRANGSLSALIRAISPQGPSFIENNGGSVRNESKMKVQLNHLAPSPPVGAAACDWGRATVARVTDQRGMGVGRSIMSLGYILRVLICRGDAERLVRRDVGLSGRLPKVLTLVLEPDLHASRAHLQAFRKLCAFFSGGKRGTLPNLVENFQLISISPSTLLLDGSLLLSLRGLAGVRRWKVSGRGRRLNRRSAR
jgi:hypothetical protein